MAVIGLSLFTFRLEHTDKTQRVRVGKGYSSKVEYANLNDKIAQDADIFELLNNFVQVYNYNKNNTKSSILKLNNCAITNEEIKDKKFRHMMIFAEYGESGYTASIINDTTGELKYDKPIDEATMTRINVSILVDEDGNSPVKKGFIIFQTVGNTSIKTQFIQNLKSFLKESYNTDEYKYKLMLDSIVPTDFVKELLSKNTINKIELIAYQQPKDKANLLEDNFEFGTKKMVFSEIGKVTPLMNKISDFLDSRKKITEVIEIPEFEYNDIKIELKLGNRKRMLDLGKIDKTKIKINLPEDIKNIEGHADIDKLREEINELYLLYSENVNLHM